MRARTPAEEGKGACAPEGERLKRIGEAVLRSARSAGPGAHMAAARALTWIHYATLSRARRLRRQRVDVLFFPEQPTRMDYAMWKICAELGLHIISDPSKPAALALLWKDSTSIAAADLAAFPASVRVINGRCRDISKSNVSRHFSAVFGYGYEVDPTCHRGVYVQKSEENGRHDGRILATPLAAPRVGTVYQRVINNGVAGGLVEDIRVPLINGIVPFVFTKYRPVASRFKSHSNFLVYLRRAEEVLTPQERRNIAEFAAAIGIDYGELDVLRDRDDGRIYVVDVNKTPWGPSYRLARADYRCAIKTLARVFREQFLPELGP